ncbi:hypothetical protein ABIE13_004875 [Ottowia thiooxydans]|uniref:Uncharacterized protein n=1 Tax=Ottowia thiooxydans TaxID=219182 RepID=A0ABV2QFR5_9BURK
MTTLAIGLTQSGAFLLGMPAPEESKMPSRSSAVPAGIQKSHRRAGHETIYKPEGTLPKPDAAAVLAQ